MGNTFLVSTTAMLVAGAGLFLALEKPDWIPVLGGLGEDPILVFLVEDRRGVDLVREAVDPSRIVAETPDAVALVEGRMIAVGAQAVSAPLMAAGWSDRELELFTVPKRDGLRRDQSGKGDPSADPRHAKLMELMNKPTLSRGEAMFVMQAMNDGLL